MSGSPLRFAIANPLTLVGKELQSILHERGMPYAHMELVDTTGIEGERLTEVNAEAAVVLPAGKDSFIGADVVFFCGPAEANERWAAQAVDDGAFVVDLSQPSQAVDGIAIVIGVNDHAIEEKVVAISPHPVVVSVALITAALKRLGAIRICTVSAIQPASEFGQPGVDELFEQTINALNMRAIPKHVFERQLAFNLYPAAGGGETEAYIGAQLRAIVGTEVPISVSITQGTTFHSHSFSLFVQFDHEVGRDAVAAELDRSEAIEVAAADDTFATIDAAGRDQLLIGRIQPDPNIANAFWIWGVVDNLRRGAALNAALIAEEYLSRFGSKPN